MDCGTTCLYMIGRYYCRAFSLEKLRELTEIGKEGVNLLGISDAAEKKYETFAIKYPMNWDKSCFVSSFMQLHRVPITK